MNHFTATRIVRSAPHVQKEGRKTVTYNDHILVVVGADGKFASVQINDREPNETELQMSRTDFEAWALGEDDCPEDVFVEIVASPEEFQGCLEEFYYDVFGKHWDIKFPSLAVKEIVEWMKSQKS